MDPKLRNFNQHQNQGYIARPLKIKIIFSLQSLQHFDYNNDIHCTTFTNTYGFLVSISSGGRQFHGKEQSLVSQVT